MSELNIPRDLSYLSIYLSIFLVIFAIYLYIYLIMFCRFFQVKYLVNGRELKEKSSEAVMSDQ